MLCVLGVRYPVKMLPLLFFEFAWKAIWVVSFGLPRWLTHQLTADTADTLTACLIGVIGFSRWIRAGSVIQTADDQNRAIRQRRRSLLAMKTTHSWGGGERLR